MTDKDKRAGAAQGQQGDNKANAGPDRLSPELDASKQWDDVASEPGFQRGDQGGYKGSYDETKFEQVKDKDVNPDEARKARDDAATTTGRAERGDDDGRKAPMSQNERTQDKRDNT
ncbi:MAG: hypothetical protein EON54_27200 [Alcaligenaceae bacterium]|nr:MAG: hypothetical protein EON54_27200 [Alcaligenaceae bacterium]